MRFVFFGLLLINIALVVGAGLRGQARSVGSTEDFVSNPASADSSVGVLVLAEPAPIGLGGPARTTLVARERMVVEGSPGASLTPYAVSDSVPLRVTEEQGLPGMQQGFPTEVVGSVEEAPQAGQTHADLGASSDAQETIGERQIVSGRAELSAVDTVVVGAEQGSSNVRPQLICIEAGPFAIKPDVAALLAGLEGIDPETDTYEREVADKPIYWVHIPPQRTAQDARRAQKELVSRGVESFVISDLGSLHNGISLGVFRDQKSAEMLAQRRQDIGYPVAIHESQRKRVAHFARMRAEVAKADLLVPAIAERAVGMSGEANVSIVVCAGET